MMMMFMTHQFGLNLLFKLLYLLMNLELVLNTDGQRSHIFSVSVSSMLTSSTTSMWRFSSSILISSSQSWHLPHLLYSQESQMTKQPWWQWWRVLGVEQMILILIVMDDGGHPFPMDVDGQGQITALLWQRWWWGWGKPGDRVGSYWCQYPVSGFYCRAHDNQVCLEPEHVVHLKF